MGKKEGKKGKEERKEAPFSGPRDWRQRPQWLNTPLGATTPRRIRPSGGACSADERRGPLNPFGAAKYTKRNIAYLNTGANIGGKNLKNRKREKEKERQRHLTRKCEFLHDENTRNSGMMRDLSRFFWITLRSINGTRVPERTN